jgi:hypothetical protein
MNNVLTNAEAIKECRAVARANGFTFKAYENLRINGKKAYRYADRKTGETVRGNLTLGLAYEIACSGELSK